MFRAGRTSLDGLHQLGGCNDGAAGLLQVFLHPGGKFDDENIMSVLENTEA